MTKTVDAETNTTIGPASDELSERSASAGETGVVLARMDRGSGLWVHVEDSQEDFWSRVRGDDVRRVYVEIAEEM